MKAVRLCIVCGARVRTHNARTCGPLCREIRESGKSRDQIVREAGEFDERELREHDAVVEAIYGELEYADWFVRRMAA